MAIRTTMINQTDGGTSHTNSASDLKFDVGLMVQSAANIAGLFGIFGQSLKQIDERLDDFIGGKSGEFIKTPIAGENLNKLWHSLSLSQMGEFQLRFNEWSDMIRAAYNENDKFSAKTDVIFNELLTKNMEEALAATQAGVMLNNEGTLGALGVGVGVLASADYYTTIAIKEITGHMNGTTDEEYYEKFNNMSETVQNAVKAKNAEDAQAFYDNWSGRLQDRPELIEGMLNSYNPDVRKQVRNLFGQDGGII